MKKIIKKRIRILENEHDNMLKYLNSQFVLFPKKYHDNYRKSFEYARINLAIRLWKLKIEIWKALIGETNGRKNS